MSTTTTNFGWTVPSDTDLVKDGAAAIRTALGGVDTSFVDLKGGTTGQVLSKASGTDLDFTWVAQDDSNAIQNAIVDAKGDLIAATGADTPARLAVGTNGHVLTADSAEATGMKWAAASGGGGLVKISSTSFTTSSSVNIDSVFTSTYTNYRVVVSYTSSAVDALWMRARASGTTDTSSLYFTHGVVATSSVGNAYTSSQNKWVIAGGSTSSGGVIIDFYSPNVSGYVDFNAMSESLSTGAYSSSYLIGGFLDKVYTADGFALVPASGTITGTVEVYGYAK